MRDLKVDIRQQGDKQKFVLNIETEGHVNLSTWAYPFGGNYVGISIYNLGVTDLARLRDKLHHAIEALSEGK